MKHGNPAQHIEPHDGHLRCGTRTGWVDASQFLHGNQGKSAQLRALADERPDSLQVPEGDGPGPYLPGQAHSCVGFGASP